jgi:hypothetical protein
MFISEIKSKVHTSGSDRDSKDARLVPERGKLFETFIPVF